MWSSIHGAWVVCSELGKRTKSSGIKIILATAAGVGISSITFAAECVVGGNGTIAINQNTVASCTLSSIAPEIGNSSPYNTGFLVYSNGGVARSIIVENDLTTILKGVNGISVYATAPYSASSTFDASGKIINLTMADVDYAGMPPTATSYARIGAGVSYGGTLSVGTLNLNMPDLPAGTNRDTRFEHYGVLTGSYKDSGENNTSNGLYSKALFDNLNIAMNSSNNTGLLYGSYPLLAGIRVIQGAGLNTNVGQGSAGYVEVNDNLDLNLVGTTNDVIGIYISGSSQQNADGEEIFPEVHLNNSKIKVVSTSSRANAIRLGKDAAVGTGEGRLYSTGHMEIDTTEAKNSNAIDIIWQGAILDANADTSSTEIKAGKQAIRISGNASQDTDQTRTEFNNLVIKK